MSFSSVRDVVSEYRDYVRSFIRIRDPRVSDYVKQELAAGELWPEAVLQLNPAFELDSTLGELADAGVLHPETARFFGKDTRLYRHQREALEIGLRGQSYIVTTGTDRARVSRTSFPFSTRRSATTPWTTLCGQSWCIP